MDGGDLEGHRKEDLEFSPPETNRGSALPRSFLCDPPLRRALPVLFVAVLGAGGRRGAFVIVHGR